jgi:hypothetical protein
MLDTELLPEADGVAVAALVRRGEPLSAAVEVSLVDVAPRRLRVRVRNTTSLPDVARLDRTAAARHALTSCHLVLTVEGGGWLSLADPPDHARTAAASCTNIGLWPALVGEPGSSDTILAAPVILEDHAAVRPRVPANCSTPRKSTSFSPSACWP